jgi:hypothetical protein
MKDAAYIAAYIAAWMVGLIVLGFAARVMWLFIKIGWDVL